MTEASRQIPGIPDTPSQTCSYRSDYSGPRATAVPVPYATDEVVADAIREREARLRPGQDPLELTLGIGADIDQVRDSPPHVLTMDPLQTSNGFTLDEFRK